MPFVKPLVAKFGKKEVSLSRYIICSCCLWNLIFLTKLNATQFIVILSIAMFGYGIFNLVVWAFVTDVIDYHEYLTGLREDGTVYSIYSFGRKVGQAVAGGVGGAAIAAVGYNPAASSANRKHTSMESILLGTLVPAIVSYSSFPYCYILISIKQKTYRTTCN